MKTRIVAFSEIKGIHASSCVYMHVYIHLYMSESRGNSILSVISCCKKEKLEIYIK